MRKLFGTKQARLGSPVAALALVFVIALSGASPAQAGSGSQKPEPAAPHSVTVTCPSGQCFSDVDSTSPFFSFINNLYLDSIIGGYACGAAGEPCDSQNRPYYRPANSVSRAQMTKFIDLGRRNIADATGLSLTVSSSHVGPGGFGVINGFNTDHSSSLNAGVYAEGATGVWGVASSTGTSNSYGGYFTNVGGGTGRQMGVYGSSVGYGVYGTSTGNSGADESTGIVGIGGVGGVFTGTVEFGSVSYGSFRGAEGDGTGPGSGGVYGEDKLGNAAGVTGSALEGVASSVGVAAFAYNNSTSSLGLQVHGAGHATGGFSTGLGYSLMVKYNGTAPLHKGDVLALDGNNVTVGGEELLGTVKATEANASAAMGVVQYRYTVFPNTNGFYGMPPDNNLHVQVDGSATTFQPGDLIQVVIAGQAQMQVAGTPGVGERLTLDSQGRVTGAAAGADNVIGKVAGKPGTDGYTPVLVNIK